MTTDVVTYESHDGIAIITINRPEKLNAINKAVGGRLLAAFTRLNTGMQNDHPPIQVDILPRQIQDF